MNNLINPDNVIFLTNNPYHLIRPNDIKHKSYTRHLYDYGDIHFPPKKCVKLVCSSSFANDSCKDMNIYNTILSINILPKVCVSIIFGYIPNTICIEFDDTRTKIFLNMIISFDNMTYKFHYSYNLASAVPYQYVHSIHALSSHEFVSDIQVNDDYFILANHVLNNVEYTDNYDSMLTNINDALKEYNKVVLDVLPFLKIITSLLLIQNHIPDTIFNTNRIEKKRKCLIM